MNPFSHTGLSISDSLKSVRKSVLIYETIIENSINAFVLDGVFLFSGVLGTGMAPVHPIMHILLLE